MRNPVLALVLLSLLPLTGVAEEAFASPVLAEGRKEIFVVECLDDEKAKAALLDEKMSPWFSLFTADEVVALTGEPVDAGKDAPAEGRRRFEAGSLNFTAAERSALEASALRVKRLAGPGVAFLTDRPWRFLKIKDGLASDFPHTRGDKIIFTGRMLEFCVGFEKVISQQPEARRAVAEIFWMKHFGELLMHEQLHVLQRTRPELFEPLYTRWGFEKISALSIPAGGTLPVTNPDAPSHDHVWRDTSGQAWAFAMRLRKTNMMPNLARDVTVLAWPVTVADGKASVSGNATDVSKIPGFSGRFPISFTGCDHPNEMSAYMLPEALGVLNGKTTAPAGSGVAIMTDWLKSAH